MEGEPQSFDSGNWKVRLAINKKTLRKDSTESKME